MKYLVDEALCCGHAKCVATAPEVFSLNEEGVNAAVGRYVEVEPGSEEAAQAGARKCPEAAIRVFFDSPGQPG